MESSGKQKFPSTPEGRKSLRKKFVRSLRGKPKFTECYGEPMNVYLRVRPFTSNELAAGESQTCLEIENTSSVLTHPPKDSFTFKHQSRGSSNTDAVHRFTFSHVFGPETDQKTFFEGSALSVVKDFIRGQNCLTFSYGVTNAGKTYTIHGSTKDAGILPRTFDVLFNTFQEKVYTRTNLKPKMFCDVIKLTNAQESKEQNKKNAVLALVEKSRSTESVDKIQSSSSIRDWNDSASKDVIVSEDLEAFLDDKTPVQFAFWISFAEIYNEHIYDLLEPISSDKEKKRTVLKLGDDKNGNPYVKGLRHVLVTSAEEACNILKIGQQNQRNASTKLNTNSSRSHCVFNLKLARINVTANDEPEVVKVSQLSLVDLAGSERYTKTQNTGERLKEAGNINTSIMTLGKCVELLRYNQNHTANPKNIPFRESKLTRLFQVFFCGHGKVTMIVNINQCASAFDETLHALKFSAIARKVATINIETTASYMNEHPKHDVQHLLAIIRTLQSKLADEAMKTAMMELRIRQEVSQEMSEQLAEIENNYSKRLMEDQDLNEEVFEKRIELLTNSVRKSQRRRRPCMEIFKNEDEEWVSSVLLHREQIKVKEKDQIIQCMEETIENQTKVINELKQELSRGAMAYVSHPSEEMLDRSFEDDLMDTPTSRSPDQDCPKSSKRKIFTKLEKGLVDSGNSITRSGWKSSSSSVVTGVGGRRQSVLYVMEKLTTLPSTSTDLSECHGEICLEQSDNSSVPNILAKKLKKRIFNESPSSPSS